MLVVVGVGGNLGGNKGCMWCWCWWRELERKRWNEKKSEETESVHRKQENKKVTKIRTWTTEIHETSTKTFFKAIAWFARGRREGEEKKKNAKKRNKETYAYHLSPQQLARL